MAPAAQVLHPTPMPGPWVSEDVNSGLVEDAGASKRTTTITITSTITVDAPIYTSTQCYQDPSTTYRATSRTIPKLLIHGIVPGEFPQSNSLSPLHHASHRTISTASSTPLSTTSPTPSNYPHPSPPVFLYPEPIVPPTASDVLGLSNMQAPHHPTILGRADYDIAYLSPALKLVLVVSLATITLATCWAVLVLLVNFPPGTWGLWKRFQKKERRPIDKPSKYVRSDGGIRTSGRETGLCSFQDGIELKHRPQHRHRNSLAAQKSAVRNHTFIAHRRTSSSPSAAPQFSLSAPASPQPSPLNPFLQPPPDTLFAPGAHIIEPPIQRTSSEWIADRAAFFSPPSPPYYTYSPSSQSETYSLDTDIDALEAGTAPLTGHKRATSSTSSSDSGNGALKRSLSWLDQGLGMVDEAVTRVAGGIAKWTDDDGGVLLPVARGVGEVE